MAEMVPQYTRAQAPGEKPIQAPTPAPGAELTNAPPGNGELAMMGHCPQSHIPDSRETPFQISSSFCKTCCMFSLAGFFDGGKLYF